MSCYKCVQCGKLLERDPAVLGLHADVFHDGNCKYIEYRQSLSFSSYSVDAARDFDTRRMLDAIQANGTVAGAARALGIRRTALYERLAWRGISFSTKINAKTFRVVELSKRPIGVCYHDMRHVMQYRAYVRAIKKLCNLGYIQKAGEKKTGKAIMYIYKYVDKAANP